MTGKSVPGTWSIMTLLISLAVGLVVGLFYGLIDVRSPAPPVVALVGLLGITIGERLAALIRSVHF